MRELLPQAAEGPGTQRLWGGCVPDLPDRQAGSTCGRSPDRVSLAGCIPAEPASVSPADPIVLLRLIIVNLSSETISGRHSLLLSPGLAGFPGGRQPGVSGRWDRLARLATSCPARTSCQLRPTTTQPAGPSRWPGRPPRRRPGCLPVRSREGLCARVFACQT